MNIRSLAKSNLNEGQIARFLQRVRNKYRRGDASWYFYRQMMRDKWDYSSNDQIERLYAVLCSWGMNRLGAKLAPFEDFSASIKKKENKKRIEALSKVRIEEVESFDSNSLEPPLKLLFHSLSLVQEGNPKFVTFSKTMHFLCPNLIAPMDRKYTLKFFHPSFPKDRTQEFELFMMIMEDYRIFVGGKHKLGRHLDDRWNLNIPKICDNIIIGKQLLGK